ncbi:hypothetical protein [Spiroplasma endosymbiont of Lasioglossum malachurum]|uniref:hypothetical protein n=1 Tax=Spiroplasma endosymbiont of Lasioglossum malachurum TaxID=3066319 RepID=UPI0030D4FC62
MKFKFKISEIAKNLNRSISTLISENLTQLSICKSKSLSILMVMFSNLCNLQK